MSQGQSLGQFLSEKAKAIVAAVLAAAVPPVLAFITDTAPEAIDLFLQSAAAAVVTYTAVYWTPNK